MTDSYGFSQKAAERITNAVTQVEKQFVNGQSRFRRQSPVVQGTDGFWAIISGVDYTLKTYGWIKTIPNDDGTWANDFTVTGSTTDAPAREESGFPFVPNGERVWLRPRHDYYVFNYDQQIVKAKTDAVALAGAISVPCSVYRNVTAATMIDTDQNVSARNDFDDLPLGTWVMIAKLGLFWHILPNTNKHVFVQVTGAARDGSCLWDGKIIVPTSAISPCSGSFTDGAVCKLLVLDADGGSTATTGKQLIVGDRYEAKFMFTLSGNQVYGIRNGGRSSWFCEFQLASDKAADDEAASACTVNTWWGGVDPGSTIDVFDTPLINGLYAHRGYEGDAGIAVFDTSAAAELPDGHWRILTLRPSTPRKLLGSLSSTLLASDANANVGSLVALDGGVAPAISTAANTFDLAGSSGFDVVICENLSDNSWFLEQVKHSTHKMVVHTHYDSSGHKWQQDVISSVGYVGNSTTVTEDVLTLTAVTAISTVTVSGTALKQTPETIYLPEAGVAGSTTTIDSGTTCP